MQMFYMRDGKEVEYTLETDPPEAMYWTTYRLKKSEIVLIGKYDRTTAAQIKQEIFDDILEREPNPSKKSTPAADEVPKKRQATIHVNAKTRAKQQKAR